MDGVEDDWPFSYGGVWAVINGCERESVLAHDDAHFRILEARFVSDLLKEQERTSALRA